MVGGLTTQEIARGFHLPAGEPEPWALRALLSFQLSRWSTRTGPDGELRTLDSQDRSRWDRELIADGARALERARRSGRGARGELLPQAELAARHATAPSFAATDWAGGFGRFAPTCIAGQARRRRRSPTMTGRSSWSATWPSDAT